MIDKFAAKAENWDNNSPRKQMVDRFVAEVEKCFYFDSESCVLDFGSGTGLVGLTFADRAKLVTLVDNSPAMLSMLKQKIGDNEIDNAVVIEGSVENLNSIESQDLVVSLMAFHHVPDLSSLLKGLYAVLKPNGLLFLGDLLAEDGSFHFPEAVAHNGFEEDQIKRLFVEAGFSIVGFDLFHTMNRDTKKAGMKSFPLFLLSAKKV